MKILAKYTKPIAVFFLFNMAINIFLPLQSLALTGGPSQPEVQGFQPININDMVSPFTGDFSYNIPLLDIDGYPINLAYSSGITSDQEASWAGLGWNINPGAINRSMRGLPDDFDGDLIKKEFNVKNNITIGATIGIDVELFEIDGLELGYSLGISCNNYNGYSVEQTIKPSISAASGSKGKMNFSLGITSGSNGLTVSPNLSFSSTVKDKDGERTKGMSVGTSFNSRSGLTNLTIGVNTKLKMGKEQYAGGIGTGISFGIDSYTPSIDMPMKNFSANVSLKGGVTIFEVFGNGHVSGYMSEQALNLPDNGTMFIEGYGYNNAQNARRYNGDIYALMDINREWDGPYTLNTPSMPVTNFTYDILSASGQGLSGSFRPFRNDIGYVSDNRSENISSAFSFGGELGGGNLVKGGTDVNINDVNTVTSTWSDDNDIAESTFFSKYDPANPNFEPTTYKEMGELSVDDEPSFFDNIGNEDAVRVGLSGQGFNVKATRDLVKKNGDTKTLPSVNKRAKKIKRNQTLSILKFNELKTAGVKSNNDPLFKAPSHHTGEITITRNDGARYVYGIPAYNLTQEETSFGIGSASGNSGTVLYGSTDNTVSNKKGVDHFYSSTTMPPYAHSYLLTSVLSADYMDSDKIIGPSAGDIGNYTIFKYDKIEKPYKWRTPYGEMEANHNERLKSDGNDDQANYVYGEKEIWYLSSIESKNKIAIFHTKDRKDGFGVRDRDGGIGDVVYERVTTKRLYKISLYSKPEYDANPLTAVPIKEVHLVQDYSLCPGIQNNSGDVETVNSVNINQAKGKLTLKGVYFTYGSSYKSKFSPYTFDYTNLYDAAFNPGYGLKNYDRWGNYKPNNSALNNAEFPYTDQNKALVDKYASAWTMSKITLPTGGKIKIYSESDDYAYVQDKKAMEMFMVQSITNNINQSMAEILAPYNHRLMSYYIPPGPNYSPHAVNQYITIKLREPIANSGSPTLKFFDKYLKGINEDELYFKCLVDMTKSGDYEYVTGFASVESNGYGLFGLNGSNAYEYAWIKLKTVDEGDNNNDQVHPISKAAWHFARMNMPKKVYNGFSAEANGCGIDDLLARMTDASFVKNIVQTVQGANGFLNNNNMGKVVDLSKSYVRLNSPNRSKLGGGLRVKKVEITDEWNAMVGGNSYTESYGMEYDYTTIDKQTGETYSSGVAAFEPSVGADENPFKLPVFYGTKKKQVLIPDERAFLLGPAGESYFPSPGVGYSKVTVKSLSHEEINRHATGYTVNEFYTAKDFPTIVESTTVDPRQKKTNPVFKFLKLYHREFMNVSQGYSIELNDMHGKPKANWVYQENSKSPISGVEYKYQSEKYNSNSGRLMNACTVVHPDGHTSVKDIGVEFDFTLDFRQQQTLSVSGGINANLGSFLAAFIPGMVPMVLPTVSVEKTRFRSAVATKVIYKYGILSSTIAHDLGSKIATDNIAYDSETGLVLLTKTTNNFDDILYSFNYPAHWYYEAMGQAYKNLGIEMNLVIPSNGIVSLTNADDYFFPGDEVLVYVPNNDPNNSSKCDAFRGWVSAVNQTSVTFINSAGLAFNPSPTAVERKVKIIRSGRRNMIGLGMGTIVSNQNPLNKIQSNLMDDILNSSVQLYKDQWPTFCECYTDVNSESQNSQNPYLVGLKGNWKPYKSYAYLTPRKHTWENNNTNIRTDGFYTSFNPFWRWSGSVWEMDDNNWTWTTEINLVSPYGAELEEMNALQIYSAATYGYNQTTPTAVANNSEYAELAFDGFEDYDFITCTNDHFSYKGSAPIIINDGGHTGKKHLRVVGGISVIKDLNICPIQ